MTRRRRSPLAALLAATVTVVVVVLSWAAPAAAHPLGNFTVNRYADVEVSAGVVRVGYVLDLAEIPTFQVRDELAADPDGFRDGQVEAIRDGLSLEVDGRALDLVVLDARVTMLDGQAGLETLRLSVRFEAALPPGDPEEALDARFADDGGGSRIGWREIIVTAAGDAEVLASSVPEEDLSDSLRAYPEDRLGSPLDVREATFRFTPGSEPVEAQPLDAVGGTRGGDRFTDLLDRQDLGPLVLVGMLGVAVLVGAGHALAPGHGKTVMAAYLIGTRGRPVDAVLLGVIVSAMHTASVLLLGVALFQLDESFELDRIYPVLTLVSGVGVLLVGAWLALTRTRALRAPTSDHDHDHAHAEAAGMRPTALVAAGAGARADGRGALDLDHPVHGAAGRPPVDVGTAAPGAAHDHDHADHPHDHDHADHPHDHADHRHDHADHPHDHDHAHRGHDHGPGGHSHELPEGVAPLSRRGLVLLATAGGVVPSPSAVVVLVSAFTLGRVGLGLALVAAFSVGLAATLTAVGLALVFGSRAVGDRLSTRLVRVFPVLGAVALLVLGLVLTVQGATGL